MSQLSIEEKIQLMNIAKYLAPEPSGAFGEKSTPEKFREVYAMLRGLVLDDTGGFDPARLSYAVDNHGDGTADLTVFEGGAGACISLDRDALAGLVRLLAECLAPDHGAGPDEVVRTCLEPLFGDEADLQLFCNTAAVFMAPPKDAGQGRKGPAWIHRNVKQRGPQSGSVDSALPDGESGSGLLRPFYFPFKVCNFLINSGKLCCYTVVEFFKLIRDVFDTVKEVAGNTFIAVKSEPGKIGLKLKKIIRMARYCLILIWLRIFISYLLVRTIRENLFKQDL